MVEIEPERRLHLVCEGRGPGAPVWFESGAFGIGADWAEVQAQLADQGVRSCAYDRAGLGYSDLGPAPRDAQAIAWDLDRLIAASGEIGPFVFVAHSAGGLYVRTFAGLRPDRVRGLVLVDAMTPEAVQARMGAGFLGSFRRLSGWIAGAATIGLLKPVALTGAADRIGLPADARAEKRRAMGSGRHHRTAAAEVRAWPEGVAQGLASPAFDPLWPVAVVTAWRDSGDRAEFNAARAAPARAALRGRVETVEGANHTTLLGNRYADRIVEAVRFVSEASGEEARPEGTSVTRVEPGRLAPIPTAEPGAGP